MTIVVTGTKNPIKLQAVERGFLAFQCQHSETLPYPLKFISEQVSNGGTPAQPMNEGEALRGAISRSENAAKLREADFGVGVEGGIFLVGEHWICNGWVSVHSVAHERSWIGQCPGVMVPRGIMDMILREGKELGDAEDEYWGNTNTKQGMGLTGIVSQGMITRSEAFSIATVCALGAMQCVL
ncbi:MAG: DUF84 family protein [Pseudonocardiaceae bacterium]